MNSAGSCLLIFLGVSLAVFTVDYRKDKEIFFDRLIDQCPDFEGKVNGSMKVTQVTKFNSKMYFDVKMKLVDIPNESALIAYLERCQVKENPDTCMRMTPIRTPRFCNLIGAKDAPWYSLISCLKPEFQCPIKKAVYMGINCTLDMKKFIMFPLGRFYYRLKIVHYNKRPLFQTCHLLYFGVRNKHQ